MDMNGYEGCEMLDNALWTNHNHMVVDLERDTNFPRTLGQKRETCCIQKYANIE